MFQEHFKISLNSHQGLLPFQAHSHHFWPDVSKEGVMQSWQDSITLADKKWDKFFSSILPKAKSHIQRLTNIKNPKQIVFAQNSHELIYRWLSSFQRKNLKILSTDSEFYSLKRQLMRLKEENVDIHFLNTDSCKGHSGRVVEALIKKCHELKPKQLIFSHAFFNSGFMLKVSDIEYLLENISNDIEVLIDGYHSFATKHLDLSKICKRAYFCAGGYKYAMAGEGNCFLISPLDSTLRPVNTGWFAEFAALDNHLGTISYGEAGDRFLGSTFDTTSLYRFNSVWDLWESIDPDLTKKSEYIRNLQKIFLNTFENHPNLLFNDLKEHGHFFTFRFSDNEQAQHIFKRITEKNILIDKRENYLRFGFGVYQSTEQVNKLTSTLKDILLAEI